MQAPVEIKNPLTCGKVIGSKVDYATYSRQTAKRGDKYFIMSKSELTEFAECPSRWVNGYKFSGDESTEWGSLIDCMALTPNLIHQRYEVTPETYPDSKTGEAKEWNWNAKFCKAWKLGLEGREPIKFETKQYADTAVKVLVSDKRVATILRESEKQVMVIAEYHDKETEIVVPLRVLIDIVPDPGSQYGRSLVDLKTCATASPAKWPRVVYDMGYYIQAALYLDAFISATGEDRVDFLHILQESHPPYQVGRRLLSAEFLEMGRLHYLMALRRYAACLASGFWPGYDDDSQNNNILNGWQLTEPSPYMVTK